jgi:hypothetical protein
LNATLSADLIKPRNYKLVIEMKEKVGWTRLAEEKVETEINVVASGALSLDYFSEELSKVTIYPNPVLERLNIQNLKNVNISNIKITDLSGKEVQSNIDLKSDKSIDVSSLSSGTYILSVKTENANRFIKFIKK